jgi:hypothetical protein
VRNRNQDELDAGISMQHARREEGAFFHRLLRKEPAWSHHAAKLHRRLALAVLDGDRRGQRAIEAE